MTGRKRKHSPDHSHKRRPQDDGHMRVRTQDQLRAPDTTYTVDKRLGEGTFGRVYECTSGGHRVAVKIIRNIPKYITAAQEERKILTCISKRDSEQQHPCVHLLNYFELDGHVCMVFPLLGQSLYDVLKDHSFIPFTMETLRSISHQCIAALTFLHRNMITHTDIKPENILFEGPVNVKELFSKPTELHVDNPRIKMIDFGSATFDWDYHTRVVTTRHYRAPEVILETGWSHPCDIWSIAFVLLELYTGETTFQTHDNVEHLALMEALLGPLPPSMLKESSKRYGDADGLLRWPELAEGTSSVRYVGDRPERLDEYFTSLPEDQQMLSFIRAMVAYEPADRATAAELMHHDFFVNPVPTSVKEKRS
ncbi:CMGC/CLK protein kinase [Salpingoeca rosetta]|uniref:CMGC/CLK protein kinase n=1 Tax=Salpingoeca rosetta (strain ATCC 50818 / BSB-021) TaxID=946362 RepID=F2TZJ2_SALR5|nr:CMGC/CLK protein kinase [Salpingoeca rosetta]EGD79016.1 CMGC/CLK protein kinase [Salpingoeca rosetta]|eukprot:XP_004997972.1 CMGC/CLK protein kinase [Salpingoeca rosetta]